MSTVTGHIDPVAVQIVRNRIACLMDTDPATLRRETLARIEEVHSLTEGFFAPGTPADPGPGWDSGDFGAEVTARWPHYPALSSRLQGRAYRTRTERACPLASAPA